jgi:hypothetical protein
MDGILEIFSRAYEQLLGRSSGPLHMRLILQPIVASVLAIRAGIRDARERKPVFLWTVLTSAEERRIMLQSGWKDLSKILVIALVLDTVYQLIALRAFFVIQALIVAFCVAVVPYSILRGPVNRLVRTFHPVASPAALK